MMKKTKLPEKSSRIPETRDLNWEKIIPEYLHSVASQVSESAKSHRFLMLLKDLFGIQPEFIEDYVSGIEKFIKVRQKDRILGGEVDNLFGNLIIEFERDLKKKLGEAEEQLKRYVACLWSQELVSQRRPYLCLATDGVNFAIYSPIVIDPEKIEFDPAEISLNLIEQVDWAQLSPQEVYFWLDRYFLRKEKLTPRSEDITKDFGVRSHAFQMVSQILSDQWEKIKDKSEFKIIYDSWEKYIQIVYGSDVGKEELFCRHTYLGNLTKLMIWLMLSDRPGDMNDIVPVLSGEFADRSGVKNFLEEDFFSWIVTNEAKDTGLKSARMVLSLLNNYILHEQPVEVLNSVYQGLIHPESKCDHGESFISDWLAQKIIGEVLKNNIHGSVLDPACGSGKFLYFVIKEKINRLHNNNQTLQHILNSIYGMDSHPLSIIIAKAFYIFAIISIIKKRTGKISIPIYLSDRFYLFENNVQKMFWIENYSHKVALDEKSLYFPKEMFKDPSLFDYTIEAAKEYANYYLEKPDRNEKQFRNFLNVQYPILSENENIVKAAFLFSEMIRELVSEYKNTLGAFILKNIYKPYFLREKFDVVIGAYNKLSFNDLTPTFQKFLLEKIEREFKITGERNDLVNHTGLICFLLIVLNYLKRNGQVIFILPNRIATAGILSNLQKEILKNVNLKILKIWDIEKIAPLFSVPLNIFIARKSHKT